MDVDIYLYIDVLADDFQELNTLRNMWRLVITNYSTFFAMDDGHVEQITQAMPRLEKLVLDELSRNYPYSWSEAPGGSCTINSLVSIAKHNQGGLQHLELSVIVDALPPVAPALQLTSLSSLTLRYLAVADDLLFPLAKWLRKLCPNVKCLEITDLTDLERCLLSHMTKSGRSGRTFLGS